MGLDWLNIVTCTSIFFITEKKKMLKMKVFI